MKKLSNRHTLLFLPMLLAALVTLGLQMFLSTQANAAPAPAPPAIPLADPWSPETPTTTGTYLGPAIHTSINVSTGSCYRGHYGDTGPIEFETEDYLVGMLVNRVGYMGTDDSQTKLIFDNSTLWGRVAWYQHTGDDWVFTCAGRNCNDYQDDVEEILGYSVAWMATWNGDKTAGQTVNFQFRYELFGCQTVNQDFVVWPVYSGIYTETECIDDYELVEMIVSDSVDADDEDGNTHELIEGNYYYIQTSGGPWNDGVLADRYDMAYSWDGIEWAPLFDMTELTCEGEPIPPWYEGYFHAVSETISLRVNDTGIFSDNTGSMDYFIYSSAYSGTMPIGTGSNCADYYTFDETEDWVSSGVVYPNQQNGTELPYLDGDLGEWYVIETAGGPWTDAGQGSSYEMDFTPKYYSPNWELISADGNHAACYEDLEDGHWRIYLQPTWADNNYGLRVHDQDTTPSYSDNSGTMGYNIYNATLTLPAEPCESLFVSPDPQQTMTIYADRSNGYEWLGWWPQSYFQISSRGGPWNEGPAHMNYFWDLEISEDGGDTWFDFADYPEAACVGYTDENHPRIYIKPVSGNEYYFRIKDQDSPDNYTDNSGLMYLDIASVEFVGVNPGDTCDSFSVGTTIVSGTVNGGNQVGVSLPALTDGEMYALETWGAPWYDANDSEYKYTGQVTQDGYWSGIFKTWYEFSQFPAAACVEDTGSAEHIRIFFRGDAGNEYMVRPDAEEPFNPANTGALGYKLSGVTYTAPGSCADDYDLEYVIESGSIYAHLSGGVQIGEVLAEVMTGTLPAGTYRLAVYGGPWNDGTDNKYDVDISDDGGATWQPFDEYADSECYDTGTDDGYWGHQYFTASGEEAYRLRVGDTGIFTDNTGSMVYILSSDDYHSGTPPSTGSTPGVPPSWATGCYEVCSRPSSILQVPDWLEYGRCELFRWLSWCPWHTQALYEVRNGFLEREPFATVYAMVDIVNHVDAEINSYEMGGDNGGMGGFGSLASMGEGGGDGIVEGLEVFASVPEDSPYNGGTIDLFPDSSPPYSTFCQYQMLQVLGSRFSTGVCWALNVADQIGYLAWAQLIYDLSVGAFFLFYVYNRWINPA